MAGAYIYLIRDPRNDEPVFVGSAYRPWEAVTQHLKESTNPDVRDWADGLKRDFPQGLEILDHIVCDAFHGEPVEIPPVRPGFTRIKWEILDQEPDPYETTRNTRVIPLRSRKAYWIERLTNEGHHLLNGKVGRPKSHEPEDSPDPEPERA